MKLLMEHKGRGCRVAYITDDAFQYHNTGTGHPERGVRLKALFRDLKKSGLLAQLELLHARMAPMKRIESVHSPAYIEEFRQACERGESFLHSLDCVICSESFDVALWASGAVLCAVDWLMDSGGKRAFCAVRPPGHHAERDRAMGFCFFNNVAVAVRYVQSLYGVERVCVVDWDVHHGNGTQRIFEDDPTVLYCSIHEDPRFCYPGSGFEEECGVGAGVGFTVNCPVLPGTGDELYLDFFEARIARAVEAFCPQFIFISAGFDAHVKDPLAHVCLSEKAFTVMTRRICELANAFCEGKLVSVLEGGYDLSALSMSVHEHLCALLDA